ncbi:hypothetical protein CRUP_009451 [Coryphaenoides rupestris]|nr:hypothetical protein CRUP_009451 [Coryphaenoides rupestris]
MDVEELGGKGEVSVFSVARWLSVAACSPPAPYLENFKTQAARSAVNVREGQGVVLLCGPPTHSGELAFAWIFNEYPYFVQQDTRRFISQETGSLYVAKVETSDVGNYTCVVNNTVTREKVLSLPTPLVLRNDGVMGEYEPKIEVHFPDSIPAAKGATVKLECFALGKGKGEVSVSRCLGGSAWRRALRRHQLAFAWIFNEYPYFVQQDTRRFISQETGSLYVAKVETSDVGNYTCVVNNTVTR